MRNKSKQTLPLEPSPNIALESTSLKRGTHSIEHVLKDVFGLKEFRAGQREAVESVLRGEDLFVTMPTSSGKSLCFQLPAVMQRTQGVTVVLSPLIALMRDQTSKLRERGIGVACVDSLQKADRAEVEWNLIKDPNTALIYVSPERFTTQRFVAACKERSVVRLVVDEAHCVSTWGHDFRPSYQRIPQVRAQLGNPPIACFTATAPVLVREDAMKLLGMKEAQQFTADLDRPNLEFNIIHCVGKWEREQKFWSLLYDRAKKGNTVVVYCNTTHQTEELSRACNDQKLSSRFYHAQMDPKEREISFSMFMEGTTKILFATSAFGMGVDKSDIRSIIHYEPPSSLEDYYQQAGRAGRDGLPATCDVLYDYRVLLRRRRLELEGSPGIDQVKGLYFKLWSWVKPDKRDNAVPVIMFSENEYFESCHIQDPKRQTEVRRVLGMLEEFGLIHRSGYRIGFLKKGSEINPDQFPISQDVIAARSECNIARFEVLRHFLTSDENPRKVILQHFRDNTIMERIKPWDQFLFDAMASQSMKPILALVAQRDWYMPDLNLALRSGPEAQNSNFGLLKNFSMDEIREEILHINSLGLVRLRKTEKGTLVTMTHKGSEQMAELHLPPPEPIENWEALKKRMHSNVAKPILRHVLSDWFETQALAVVKPVGWWEIMDHLRDQKFQVFGESISGQQLVECFHRRKYNRTKGVNPIKGDAKEMLNYLFNDRVKTS